MCYAKKLTRKLVKNNQYKSAEHAKVWDIFCKITSAEKHKIFIFQQTQQKTALYEFAKTSAGVHQHQHCCDYTLPPEMYLTIDVHCYPRRCAAVEGKASVLPLDWAVDTAWISLCC